MIGSGPKNGVRSGNSGIPTSLQQMDQFLKRVSSRRLRQIVISVVCLLAAAALATLILRPTPPPAPGPSADETGSVTAQTAAMPSQGWFPLTVNFSGYASHSTDGKIVSYEWDIDGNGVPDISTGEEGGYAVYTFGKPGTYPVTLTVHDDRGRTSQQQVLITVWHPSQNALDYSTVFDDERVGRIDITLAEADWQKLWSAPEEKYEAPADAVVFGEPLNDVGLRMRGQFSLRESRDKKPWRIDTDTYIAGQEFHNLRALLLLNNIGDPTLLKEKLAYELMYFAGVPASHSAFVELWFDLSDDEEAPFFWGVYSMVERVDKKYLMTRFGRYSKTGNLYKASHAERGPMDLVYYGESIEDYPTTNGLYAYGKETNIDEADYSDIIELARVLDETYATPEDFCEALEAVINVDGFLRYMSVITALASWDSYPNTGNNYYLFENPLSGRFEWIPWDLTWDPNPTAPVFQTEGPRLVPSAPLYDKVMQVEEYRRQYAAYLDLLLRNRFNYEHIHARAGHLHELIAPSVAHGDRLFFGQNVAAPPELFEEWEALSEFARERNAYIRSVLDDEMAGSPL